MRARNACFLLALALASSAGRLPAQALTIWPVDPLVKVFADSPPSTASAAVEIQCGANEYVSAQVAVRADRDVKGLAGQWQGVRHTERDYTLPAGALQWRFVGFIPINKNTPNTPSDILVRTAPCEVPDPLLEARALDLAAGHTQPVWLTARIPRDAPPGRYRGDFAVVGPGESATIRVDLEVFPYVLPDARHLWVTHWFNAGRIARAHSVEPWSTAHWSLLGRYARNMAAHRQNVALTPLSLVTATQEPGGRIAFDYTRLDRWVRVFEAAGACDRIEIGHVAHHTAGGWASPTFSLNPVAARDRATGGEISLPPETGLAPLLADLERHLAERGWLDKTMIHIGDEPALHNVASWRDAAAFVRRAAPRLRRIEAIETRHLAGDLEVWVPKLSYFPGWREEFAAAQRAGNELWFYTCLHPQGYYPNRFLDYPLVGTRALHWINWAYGFDGYLHWGLEAWPADPFGPPADRLPPGDTHIIYPGADGPLDSIRWEMLREGLQDYEALRLLAERTQGVVERLGGSAATFDPRRRSDEIARRIVPGFADYERNPAAFRAVRRMLMEELATIDAPPLAVIACAPAAESDLPPGPIVVEIEGLVEPGAAVTMGGRPVEVGADGRFIARAFLSPRNETVEFTIARDGQKKTLRRHFRVRPI